MTFLMGLKNVLMSLLIMFALHLYYCYALCLSNECMCLFVSINYFICASNFLCVLVLAYVHMQRHSKSDLFLVVQTFLSKGQTKILKGRASVYSCSHMLHYFLTSTKNQGV